MSVPAEPEVAQLSARAIGLDDIEGPVVVACSGGADSLALLVVAVARGLTPTAAYIDHGLRPESRYEAELVAGAAQRLGAQFSSTRVCIEPGRNLEARARAARYTALEATRARVGASVVLVAHTADDQAETVVLNLLRGSASAGLGGMAVRRGTVVRPFLRVRRSETEAACTALGLDPVRDPMNNDLSYRRVWVRRVVLPLLSEGAGRDLVPVLERQARLLRAESDYLDELAGAAWPLPDGSTPAPALTRLPLVLARRAVRMWVGPPPPTWNEVERVLAVARCEVVATEVGGGRRISRHGGQLRISGTAQ